LRAWTYFSQDFDFFHKGMIKSIVPALLVTDTSFLRNPNYHLPTDTIETLDFEFMQKVAVGIGYSVLDLAK